VIVVDANIIAQMTFPGRFSAEVSALHEKNPQWVAPAVWKVDFLNILALYFRKGMIDHSQAATALDVAERLIGSREHILDAKAILQFIVASTCSAHDGEFVVLARKLGTRIITYNGKLIEQFPDLALTPEEYLKK
jgi:predicted nucleic acid-binding protein